MPVVLHSYWRSSAAYRVRIALNLKGMAWQHRGVSLIADGGQHNTKQFAALNPQKLLPVLEIDGLTLTQSLAIIDYLEETRPEPALLPEDPVARARVRSLAQAIACDIHPVNNLRVLNYLSERIAIKPEIKSEWYRHWISEGFRAIETILTRDGESGTFCHGKRAGLADICLIPQVYNAQRFEVDLAVFPTIQRIYETCLSESAFAQAAPENQPDAV